jgi:hypothetical protein
MQISDTVRLILSYAGFLTPGGRETDSTHLLLATLLVFDGVEHPLNTYAMKAMRLSLKEQIAAAPKNSWEETRATGSSSDYASVLAVAAALAKDGDIRMPQLMSALLKTDTKAYLFCQTFNEQRKKERGPLALAAILLSLAFGLLLGGDFSPYLTIPISFIWGWLFYIWLQKMVISWAPLDRVIMTSSGSPL